MTNSKVFLTGGAGFIGTHLARALATCHEVILFDNLHHDAYRTARLDEVVNVRLVPGDVRDLAAIRRALEPDVEYVIHAAAIAGVDTVVADPLRVLDVNVKGTFNIAEATLGLKSLKMFVDFSTSEVFGRYAHRVDECEIRPTVTIGEPRWTYAMSKLVGELIVHAHHLQNRMPTVTLRPFNVYGPNQVGTGAIHHFVKRAIAGEELVIHGDGSQIRAWCYVEDFVRAVLLAMESETSAGRSYNIGDPRSPVTVHTLAHMIVALSGSSSTLTFKPMSHADVTLRIPSIKAAREDLGFEPAVGLEDGLLRTIAWYRGAR